GLVGGAIPMSASAVTYDPCDVNHDGSVDILDVLSINRYLSGQKTVKDYNQLDANKNLIVDSTDADYVMAKVTGLSYTASFYSRTNNKYYAFPSVPSNIILNGISGSTSSRTYKKYSYDSKTEIGTYSLTPNVQSVNAKSNSDVSTCGVQGTDDRVKASNLDENTGIVLLNGNATGFIVGDHVIATAAHCVYNGGKSYFYGSMTIETYNKNGELSGETLNAVEAHIPEGYALSPTSIEYDYALITVEDDLSEDNGYFHFKLGTAYNTTPSYFSNTPIYVTGRPDYLNFKNNSSGKFVANNENWLYTGEGRVINIYNSSSSAENNTQILYYDADTSGGDSGAP
ncbi:MAG: trypsin-like peptidase domain-containing protein, partial [Oscillospiraceae bacterium]|nr:trypsin-like peptidase domain-containing protein [Oscillospiraceae bacterium]